MLTDTESGAAAKVTIADPPLVVRGVAGPLRADTDGGTLTAQDIASATATVTTGGGAAMVTFAAAPRSVSVSTDGGAAVVAVPGGPYAVTADSNGGPQSVAIATDPAAYALITVTSGGGPLRIEPAPVTAGPS